MSQILRPLSVTMSADSPVFIVRPTNTTGNLSMALSLPCVAESTLTPDIMWYRSLRGSEVKIPGVNETGNGTDQRVYVNEDNELVFTVRAATW